MRPRTRFCWLCGNKLYGNHFTEIEIDGHLRILHKECAKNPEVLYQRKGCGGAGTN